jgi:hypothetical protein
MGINLLSNGNVIKARAEKSNQEKYTNIAFKTKNTCKKRRSENYVNGLLKRWTESKTPQPDT